MTRREFDTQMRRLVGLKWPPATMETHYAVLGNLAVDVLAEGVTLAQREVDNFPSPNALLQFVYLVKNRVEPLPELDQEGPLTSPFAVPLPGGRVLPIKREWKYYCTDCQDSGWASMWCGEPTAHKAPWMALSQCQRDRDHLPHEFVVVCRCSASNPAIQKRKESQARQAAVRTSGRQNR
jgi:hypothetical protein